MNADKVAEILLTRLTLQIGPVTLHPLETLVFALALAAALVSLFNIWRIGRGEHRQQRLEALRAVTTGPARANGDQAPPWYRYIGRIVAASPIVGASERQRLNRVLAQLGIRGQGNLATFVTLKVSGGLGVAALIWMLLVWRQLLTEIPGAQIALIFAGFMLGWRLPDIVLSRLTARRRRNLEYGMPDALDLLVVCAEAGLSLNQAIDEVSRGIRPSSPMVADEFAATAAEMRVQPDVDAVLDNMAQRCGLDSLRGIIATLKQSLRFGTPLAESLRLLAAEMRMVRQARMEERTARLPVLLAIPIMMFILPSLLMVIGAPIVLRVLDTVRNLLSSS